MLRIPLCAVFVALSVLPLHAQQDEFELPADSYVPVITLNYVGGFTQLPRQNVLPQLSIRADGKVVITDPFGKSRDVEGTLSYSELRDLMRFVVLEQGFFQFNASEAQAGIFAQNALCGKSMAVVSPGTTVIHVKTADNEQEARFNALGIFASAYPAVQSLTQLWTIETKLRYLMEEVRAGGRDAVANGLEQANSFMKRQPIPVKLEVNDLRRSVSYPDGRRMLEFVRDSGDGTSVSVDVEYNSKAIPSFSYRIDLNPPLQPPMTCP